MAERRRIIICRELHEENNLSKWSQRRDIVIANDQAVKRSNLSIKISKCRTSIVEKHLQKAGLKRK